jgi:hypothetical protein
MLLNKQSFSSMQRLCHRAFFCIQLQSNVRLDLFGYQLWKIPDCCNHFAMAMHDDSADKNSQISINE